MVIRQVNLILSLILALMPTFSMAVQLEAVPDRIRVGLEESFTLELRADGSVDGDPDLSVLEKDFEVLGRSQASQIQVINGDFSRTTTWSLSLLARSSGSKIIPPLCIADDCSTQVTIEVLPVGQDSSVSSGEELLLEVSTQPGEVVVQSQLLYKVRLLTRLNFLQANLSEPEPSGVEVVVQKLGEDRNYETVQNGLRYRAVERNYAIFPQQSGRLTIPPLRLAAQIAVGGRGGFDPFNQRTRQLRRQSDEISVEVLPAPAADGRPWLPANDLQLEDDWQHQPPQLIVGEPATRTVTMRANGVPAAQLPLLVINTPDKIKSYPDQPSRQDRYSDNGVQGTLQQKLAIVPTKPGHLNFPGIKVEWWDLRSGSWQQATLPAIELEVLPSPDSPVATSTPAVKLQEPQVSAESQSPPSEPPKAGGTGVWPWLSLSLAGGWLMSLLWWAKTKRLKDKQETVLKQDDELLSLKKASRELTEVLESGDQGRVRNALLCWGTALFPDQKPGNLEELATLCGDPLRKSLESFNRNRYSRECEPCDLRELSRAIEQTEREKGKVRDIEQLPPLYPR